MSVLQEKLFCGETESLIGEYNLVPAKTGKGDFTFAKLSFCIDHHKQSKKQSTKSLLAGRISVVVKTIPKRIKSIDRQGLIKHDGPSKRAVGDAAGVLEGWERLHHKM